MSDYDGDLYIDHLRERIKELEDECVQSKQGYTAIRNDMSRLSRESGERIKDLQTELAVCDGREAVLCTRIEELEQSASDDETTIAAWNKRFTNSHHITDEQIDAAVHRANNWKHEWSSVAWELLNKLGIEQCGICDRSPGKQYEWGKGDELQPCTNCSGHGWVKIGGGDD